MSRDTQTRIGIYCRVSTMQQAEGNGLELQLADTRRHAQARNYEVVHEWSDIQSGANDDRPGFLAMQAAVQRGEVARVIVWDVTRFGRNAATSLKVAQDFRDLEVIIEDTQGRSSDDKVTFGILQIIADYEKDTIKSRMVGGRRIAASKGQWIGGSHPMGYTTDENKRLVINEEEAEVVRTIYQMALQPDKYPTHMSIARELRKRGVRPRKIRDWGTRDVKQVFGYSHIQGYLADTIYKGAGREVTIAGETFTVPAPPIVDEETWEHAQRIVEERKRVVPARGQARSQRLYGLSGRISHRHPDGIDFSMIGELKVRQGRYAQRIRLYRCSAMKKAQSAECPGTQVEGPRRTSIHADDVEARVLLMGLRMIDNPDLFAQAAEDHQRSLVAAREDVETREAFQARLDGFSDREARIIESYMDGLVTKEVRDKKLIQLASEREDTETALERLDEMMDPTDLLTELMQIPISWEPEPGDFQPGDIEWRDIEKYLRKAVKAYQEEAEPLSDNVSAWIAMLANVLGLEVVVHDRGTLEANWAVDDVTL